MKLTSTSDYILEYVPSDEPCVNTNERTINHFTNHANLVKRTLILGMFIPCDEDGNVMNHPSNIAFPNGKSKRGYLKQYQQAKERVLFKYFSEIDCSKFGDKVIINCMTDNIHMSFVIGEAIINDLIKSNLTLTESAIKQLQL